MVPFLQRFQQKRRARRAGSKKQAGLEQADATSVPQSAQMLAPERTGWQVLRTYQIPSEVGNERLAISDVMEAVNALHVPESRLDQLGTAVGEATMNAMEHGNCYNPEIPVVLQVLSSEHAIAVRISDQGSTAHVPPQKEYEVPDIEAKLAEHQSPRGWGLFLIQNMVDEMHVFSDEQTHTIELILYLEGKSHE